MNFPKDVKCVIFDMDGVIIDSEEIHKKAYYETFASIGVFKLKLKTVSSLGFFSDWNFNKTELESKTNFSWEIRTNKSVFHKIPQLNVKFKNRIQCFINKHFRFHNYIIAEQYIS